MDEREPAIWHKKQNSMSREYQTEDDFDELEYSDEDEFIPCSRCDGHPACEDFGCAFECGCGHLVKKIPGNDFDY